MVLLKPNYDSLLNSRWNHISEHSHWSPSIWNICISVTRFCWVVAPCWRPYTRNQVTGQILVYIYFSLSLLFCRRQGFFGRASSRQETETKELLYCGKGQRSWLFLRQADTVAVLKSAVKIDNKIVKQEQRVACHNVTWTYCSSKSQITASPIAVKSECNVTT